MKTAGLITNNELPILGVNSDPSRRTGALLNVEIRQETMAIHVARIMDTIQEGRYSTFYRTRALFEIDGPQKISKLCLNEIFAAEKDVSCTSMF